MVLASTTPQIVTLYSGRFHQYRRAGFNAADYAMGFLLEAIFFRRATITNTMTTNNTPAMMRMVVASIEIPSCSLNPSLCPTLC